MWLQPVMRQWAVGRYYLRQRQIGEFKRNLDFPDLRRQVPNQLGRVPVRRPAAKLHFAFAVRKLPRMRGELLARIARELQAPDTVVICSRWPAEIGFFSLSVRLDL